MIAYPILDFGLGIIPKITNAKKQSKIYTLFLLRGFCQ
jgi:hypothetical protein